MKRKGSIYIAALILFSILLSFGLIFVNIVKQENYQGKLSRNFLIAKYLANAGVNGLLIKLDELSSAPLIMNDGRVNEKKLDLLDRNKAGDFSFMYEDDELIENGKVKVTASIVNIRETPFRCGILTDDPLPDELKAYKIDPKTFKSEKELGGWEGKLQIKAVAEFEGRKYRLEVVKGIKVMDLSPCAPRYSLFVQGKKQEILKAGKFVVSNWQFKGELYKKFSKSLKKLSAQVSELLGNTSGLDLFQMINVIKTFVMVNNDMEQRRAAEELIMSLSPWGYVRTNGELHVYLPFFEVDDIIHYFVINPYFQRPEIGYPGSYSRLHDLYMAKYTRYEGNIRKFYYRLAPYILQRQYPRKINEKYTRYSTYPYFPIQRPEKFYAVNYKRYFESSREYCAQLISKDIRLVGTKDNPIILNGLTFINGNLYIEGFYKGKGVLVVKNGNVKISGNIKRANDDSKLVLFVSNGYIYLDDGAIVEFEGSIFSNNSIKGGKKMSIFGNLVVNNLNHQDSLSTATPTMPFEMNINYDPDIRNILANNLVVTISKSDILRRRF